jgi:hypothetical protein
MFVGAGVLFAASLVVALVAPRREDVNEAEPIRTMPLPSPIGE